MTDAIIETGGMQFPVTEGETVDIPKLDGEVGDKVTFDKVLFAAKGDERLVGKPTLADAIVKGEIVSHGRTEKILVYKFKRRTKYRRKNGHRQQFTTVKITGMAL